MAPPTTQAPTKPTAPAAHPTLTGPLVVAVMDGVGLGRDDAGNAVFAAHTPTLDAARARGPFVALQAHGPAVGLAGTDDMGNSEVGHNALGSGQIYDQGAKRVAEAVADGSLFEGPLWRQIAELCQPHPGGTLHLLGLLSDGNIHSHSDHALALIERAHSAGIARLRVHALLDGRDVGRVSALTYVDALQAVLDRVNAEPGRDYAVASGGGRMQVTMDRYQADWPMVERGWRCHVRAEGRSFSSLREAVQTLRQEQPNIADQDLPAFVIASEKHARGPIQDGDALVLFNFRGDRMLEWVDAMEAPTFTAFARGEVPRVLLAGMTLYDGDTGRPKNFLVQPPQIRHTLSELLDGAGVAQLACSETQKFGHVTYFWNGNRSKAFPRERSVEVPSLPAPFDGQPGMRAHAIVDAVVAALRSTPTPFCRLNLANGDMVGHTGNFAATVQAMEAVDAALARLVEVVVGELGGAVVITADHGNAEDMAERDKKSGEVLRDASGALVAKTSHSLNPVPCAFVLPPQLQHAYALADVTRPGLANVAATCAVLLGLAPHALWQPSLLRATGAPGDGRV